MIKHIVFWKLKDTADKKADAYKIKEMLEGLQGKINGLLSIEVGIDFSKTEQSADVALYSEFVNREALEAYQQHPEHQKAAQFVRECVSSRMVVDYEVILAKRKI